MLIQKTFHLRMAREVAKAKLSNLAEYRRHIVGIEALAPNPGGGMRLKFQLPCGPLNFRGDTELEALESDNPNQTLFRSCGGNMEIAGVVEYFEIKPNLTEVVFTLDYVIGSPFMRGLDFVFKSVDRFLSRQVERVEACFAPGPRASVHANLAEPINGHSVPGKAA